MKIAKIIYKFVQEKTRYISVQVDIGGWQPITANKVDEVSYGDCKGLTNYTKALLDVVGVKSHHVILYASNNRNVDKNFTVLQGNHMILNIPNEGDDIWLECTSQTIPFGFLGDFTDDRDVLVITPEGGIIKRTPAYINDNNLQILKADINLLPNGNIIATLEKKSYGSQYNDRYHIESYTKKEIDKEKINSAFQNFSQKSKVLEITQEKLVSIDFNHNPASSIVDTTLTNVVGKNMGKISAWYDNEWGFSNRMCDIAEYLHKIS